MSQVVGNIHRKDYKANDNGKSIELLRAAGAIPLLVSGNPEFCMAWETTTHIFGKMKNPYDTRRTPGGSSGGEGALNGNFFLFRGYFIPLHLPLQVLVLRCSVWDLISLDLLEYLLFTTGFSDISQPGTL